ncbi:MAG TPA: helix-turn-helix transcriptional regulator [Gemmatimonadales bacterium]
MTRRTLGEFEHLVLLTMLRLEPETYGVPIVAEIARRAGQRVSRAAVYVALRRLELKGLVASRVEARGESPGKPRVMFRLAPRGRARLVESRRLLLRMWEGLEPLFEPGR